MWESAVPQPESAGGRSDKHPNQTDSNVLLWVQLLLCGAALIFVLAADAMKWSVSADLRVFYETQVRRGGTMFLLQERDWARFVETGLTELRDSAAEVFSELSAATPETARSRRGRSSPQSYVPDFALIFPLPGGLCEKTSGYGWRTDPMGGQGTDYHTGTDLAVGQGTPVLAAADGVVRRAAWHSSYGNYIRVLHRDGDETLYAHMQYLFVHSGEQVAAGQVLGTVGSTGNATGPHLHFELLHGGTRYDPTQALEQAAS